ncbi:brain-specific angiogenesis inhibitor 1-associated protein 2-like protein 2 [Synchiropus splendidus]|uniref:brain-specific angiogenesis inhibitor 1-associated protein 2-like protein 2 n=1 Tax=Synchiropus splendidus TaxID=270530 RepID=UPI00237EBE1B|nr:brain-specific angiogenesis inhibitor 1-associated protein 2-like protein 2 [Synchiropus splendidus]
MSSDQLHRSTLGIYSNLMEEFNPSLQKLVSLGNSYVRAFHALASSSEAYFSALSRIGEQALRSVSSQPMGDVLVQISNSQRSLTTQLESVFHWFTVDVLQEMDNNVRQDRGFISSSRRQYETEVREQAEAQERERRRGAVTVAVHHPQEAGEYVTFLRESHSDALREEERRYRFVAEKHCGLIHTITSLMDKTGASLQQRAAAWREDLEATRGAAKGRTSRGTGHGQKVTTREEAFRSMSSQPPPEEAEPLSQVPSRAPSPQGSISGVTVGTVRARGRRVRARVDHQPAGSNPTLLSFSRGDSVTALVQQPRNGWLYGSVSNGSRRGWFPASYVEEVDAGLQADQCRASSLQGSGGGLLMDRPRSESQPPPPPPPPPPSRPVKADRRTESNLESKKEQPQRSHPELFPRGTNPFATVKLRPTPTDDWSAAR